MLFHCEDFGKSKLIASTRDDAAGEAFDKVARLLGFPWPGGKSLDELARKAKKGKDVYFNKIKTGDLSFSFSGIKSHARRLIQEKKKDKASLAFHFQERVVEHLMEKLEKATSSFKVSQVLVGGGVSANSRFREKLKLFSRDKQLPVFLPEPEFCCDQAAMVALTGLKLFEKGIKDDIKLPCSPQHFKEDFFSL